MLSETYVMVPKALFDQMVQELDDAKLCDHPHVLDLVEKLNNETFKTVEVEQETPINL